MDDSTLVVFCTFPTLEESKSIAKILVEKNLAACCNIIPSVISIYRWDSNVEENNEIQMIIKTTAKCYDKLEKQIKMLHSYSVPEIIGINIKKGSKAYLDWIFDSTKS